MFVGRHSNDLLTTRFSKATSILLDVERHVFLRICRAVDTSTPSRKKCKKCFLLSVCLFIQAPCNSNDCKAGRVVLHMMILYDSLEYIVRV